MNDTSSALVRVNCMVIGALAAMLASACGPSTPVPACSTAENCGQCVGIRDCGWCGASQQCIQGNSETPPATCAGEWRWVPGTCEPPASAAESSAEESE